MSLAVTYLLEDVVTPALGDLAWSGRAACDEYMLQHPGRQAMTAYTLSNKSTQLNIPAFHKILFLRERQLANTDEH